MATGFCPSKEGWGPLSPSRPVDFTTCFQHGALVSGLNVLFIIAAALRLRKLQYAPRLSPQFVANSAFWVKISLAVVALFASVAELVVAIEVLSFVNVFTVSLALQALATAIAVRLHYREQFRNRVASTPLLLFWLASALLALIRLRTSIALDFVTEDPPIIVSNVLFMLASLATMAMEAQPKPYMLYELPADDEDEDELGQELYDENYCAYRSPEERANIFSLLTFTWMTPLLEQGFRKPLQMEDTWELSNIYRPEIATAKFQRNWQNELRSGNPSLFRATMRTYGWSLALGSFYKLVKDLVSFMNPILLSRLIRFVSAYGTAQAEPIEYGYFYAISMFIVASVQTLAFQQHWSQNQHVNSLMKISYTTAIYRKTMTLSNDARQNFNIGGIVTHMSVDAQRIADFTANFSHHLWSAPLQIILALYLLYQTLGWSIFAGVLAMIISIPTSARLSRSMRAFNKLLMGYRDQRMKIMDEVLSGIKIIKLYAWETSFIRRINEIRVKLELATIRRYGRLQAIFSFVVTVIPFVVSFSTFGLYSLADGVSHGPLTPQLVFVALTLFNMLRFPLSHGPMVIPALLEAMVSSRRVFDFLVAGEIDFSSIERKPYDRDAPDASNDDVLVSVKNGAFKWLSADEPTLRNISIECKRDELVAVVGRVGSGKSSLVSSILGDMIKSAGSVEIQGSVAYVPQQAWIMNATLRDNILFGHKYDEEFYNRVINACALRPDLEMLPSGDMTEIGEKGINLSGGQKARVSLARAVYARADVYILDDPLAAVDAHVGKHLFSQVIGQQGLLKSRARILVTNAVQYLNNTDNIFMLRDGEIVDHGSFAKVMDRKGDIFEFVHRYIDSESSSRAENGDSTNGSETEYYEEDAVPSEQDGMPSPVGVGVRRKSTKQTLGRASIGVIHDATARKKKRPTRRTMTTEFSRQGKVEWNTYVTYFKACGVKNSTMFGSALLAASISNVFANMWLKHWASSNDEPNSAGLIWATGNHSVFYYLFIYGGLGLLGASMSSLQSLLLWTRCSIRASRKIHENMLRGVLRSPMSFFDVTPLGRILNRFSSDLQRCDEALPRSVSGMVNTMVSVVSAVSVIGFSTPIMLVLMFPLSFIYRYLQQRYLYSSRELRRLDSTTRSPIFAHFQESIGGVSTIRAYSQQPRFVAENENRLEKNIRAYYTYLSLNRWLSLRLETLGNIVMLGTTTLAIASLQYFGFGDAGLVGLSVAYALDFTSSLNWSVRSYTEVENSMIQLERVTEYAHLHPEAPEVIEDNRPKKEWPEHGMIEFKNYSTRYREGLDLVLKELSFRVMPNQKVGIVGRTGAGKSSLTLALFRIIEAAGGRVLIDGEDISQYGLFDVRSKLSIIPQDPVLFAGTVRENLDPFEEYADQDIWRALEHAHLAEFIHTKDEGLEFVVTQGGENFSVGQRQLICLARALLKRAKILVLDEATAAIDNSTDAIIQESIRKEFKDCTVLTIAHRLNTIIDSDMILVVDSGRLAEYDTPQNLLANDESLFSKLVEEARTSDT
ncbi:P-loop containing nucleoside triphosphate hydrolase protein [Coemansia spiralis]|nr:P-loop containing nucleoside triphosphate hydrolase protein [Coemansia spiralis]